MKNSTIRRGLPAMALGLACAAACTDKTNVRVIPIAAGAQCPNGGEQITVDDGAPEVVCNGASGTSGTNGADGGNGANGTDGSNGSDGFTTLFVTRTLSLGDAHCPDGGEQIQSGLDNGAGGGTAKDGVLQPGEVTGTSYVCNGTGLHIGSITPPAGAPGNATVTAVGGAAGDAGQGGQGGFFLAGFNSGSEGGHVKIFQTGAADPSFTFPAEPAVDLGAHPAIIASDTTLGGFQPDAGNGALYLTAQGILYVQLLSADGGADYEPATGLSIASGATVSTSAADAGTASLQVFGPCLNAGTLTAAEPQKELDLTFAGYFGAATSRIVNDGASADGGSDGIASPGITLHTSIFWNHGAIEAIGGDGPDAGAGGEVIIALSGGSDLPPIYNTGSITARGGSATVGVGGAGGVVEMSGFGDVNNSGALDASGGTGPLAGGQGGSINLNAGGFEPGTLRNSGPFTATGGAGGSGCVTEAASCMAGEGGAISLVLNAAGLVSNAALDVSGGSSPFHGGDAGQLNVYSESAFGTLYAPGDIILSGTLRANGGAGGATAGAGGQLDIVMLPNLQPNGQEISFYGYAGIDVSGGPGGLGGGNGGLITLFNTYYADQVELGRGARSGFGPSIGPGGSVINDASLTARGGDSSGANGGLGGNVGMQTQDQVFFPGDDFEQVVNAGAIDVSGGAGTSGGGGGTSFMYGNTGVTNSGPITSRGGAGVGAAGIAGGGAAQSNNGQFPIGILLGSDNGNVTNSAVLDATGGAGIAGGGSGGLISLDGKTAIDASSLLAAGGSCSAQGALGGAGGEVEITSTGGGLSQVTAAAPASISVAGGLSSALGTAGAEGSVAIDNLLVTSSWTH